MVFLAAPIVRLHAEHALRPVPAACNPARESEASRTRVSEQTWRSTDENWAKSYTLCTCFRHLSSCASRATLPVSLVMADHASQHADGAGPYGLGMMPSMSQECTPLKHRYDACFNRWFEDYLGVGHLAQASASGSRSGAVSGESSRSNGLGGLFGRGSSSSSSSSSSLESISSASTASAQATSHSGAGPIQRSPEEQRRLRDRLDGECGAMWKEYQQCVLVSKTEITKEANFSIHIDK